MRQLLVWTERVLIGAGAAMLAWVAVIMLDARVAQQLARDALVAVPHASTLPGVSGRPTAIPRGAPLGELSIPRVQLSAVVFHGSDSRTLRRGPGHIENTALPGQPGNVAVAGHRDSFFRPIRNVRIGDDVFFDTSEGRFHYRVSSLDVVKPTDLSVLDNSDAATLTLITCFPFWLAGPAPDRFVVRASEVERPGSAPFLPRETAAAPLENPTVDSSSDARSAGHTTRTTGAPTTATAARAAVNEPDEVLVRRSIERFRLAYNGRLARRPDPRGSRALTLSGCAVALLGDRAVATCDDASVATSDRRQWIFSARSSDDGWSIISVEPRE